LLAVAQRRGSIAIFRDDGLTGRFGSEPAFVISGAGSRLDFSDGVAFVPPLNDHLAACNLKSATISFYRKRSDSPLAFDSSPCFEIWQGLAEPDGLAFSPSGEWLAVANHGNHSVSMFQRRNRVASPDKFRFGPAPSVIIADPGFRHPHSVAFSEADHLVVIVADDDHEGPDAVLDRLAPGGDPLPGQEDAVGGGPAQERVPLALQAIHRRPVAEHLGGERRRDRGLAIGGREGDGRHGREVYGVAACVGGAPWA